jgi:hypothetical protein
MRNGSVARIRFVRCGITLWQVILACSISITHCHDDISSAHHPFELVAANHFKSSHQETDRAGEPHSHLLMFGFELPASSPAEIVWPTTELLSSNKIEPDPISFKWCDLGNQLFQIRFTQSLHDPNLCVRLCSSSHTRCHTSAFARREISGVLRP